MDGQNFDNKQSLNNEQNTEIPQYSNYQDYTANQQPVPNYNNYNNYNNDNADGKASGIQGASLVLGILSIVFSCCYGVPGLIMGAIGLICGIKGNSERKNGVGTAGIVCSVIGLIFSVIMLIYFIAVGGAVWAILNDPNAMSDLQRYY